MKVAKLIKKKISCSINIDKTIKVWNFGTGDCSKFLEGHEENVCCLDLFNCN